MTQTSSKASGRGSSRNSSQNSTRNTIVFSVLALAVGGAVGTFATRQYYKATDVIATVQGQQIDQLMLFHRLDHAGGLPMMKQIAMEDIQMAYAKERGCLPSNADVDKAVAAAMTDPDFSRQVKSQPDGNGLADYRHDVLVNLTKASIFTKGITVTPEEVKSFYNANIDHKNPQARFYSPAGVTIQVIQNHSKDAIDAAHAALGSGMSFDDANAKFSQDSRRDGSHGISPPLAYGRNTMTKVPGMEAAIFGMKIGEVSIPRTFAGEWFIFKCLDKTAEKTVPFARAEMEAEVGAKMAKITPDRAKSIQDDFKRYQQTASLQVFWPEYKDTLKL